MTKETKATVEKIDEFNKIIAHCTELNTNATWDVIRAAINGANAGSAIAQGKETYKEII